MADRIQALAIQHPEWSAAQAFRLIEEEFGPYKSTDGVPSLRTVERYWSEFNKPDESGRWTLADGNPDDASLVLEVARFLVEQPADPWVVVSRALGGASEQARWPTQAMAEWIVRIRRAYPDLGANVYELELVHHLAGLAKRGGEFLHRTQLFLAYTPWRDSDALFDAVSRGLVSTDLVYGFGLGDDYGSWQRQRDLASRQEGTGER